MNVDEKISAILRAEAEAVEPSSGGWDAIRSGIDERRRRAWWVRGSGLAAVLATGAAVAVFATTDRAPHRIVQPPVSQAPTESPTPSVAPPVTNDPIGAIWPLTTTAEVRAWEADHSTYPSLTTGDNAALGFAQGYLGMTNVTVAESGDGFDVYRSMGTSNVLVSHVVVRGFGDDGGAPYVVTLARSDAIAVDAPAAGSAVASPLAAHGTYRAVDPSFTVTVRADTSERAPVDLASARATTGPPNVWDASLAFSTSARTGSLLVTNGSLADTGLAAAAAVPVTFAAPASTPPATFAAVRGSRVALLSTATGNVVRYLSAIPPGGGAWDAEVADDGKTVVYAQGAGGPCSAMIRSVPTGGGAPTTLRPGGGNKTVSHPSLRGGVLAYITNGCVLRPIPEIVVHRPISPDLHETITGATVRSGPVVGSRFVAYVTVTYTGETRLHTIDTTGELADVPVAPPAGCEWTAVTWGAGGGFDQRLVATASCGGQTRLYSLSAEGQGLTLIGRLGSLSVLSLDYSADGRHLLVGVLEPGLVEVAYTYEGGAAHRIDGVAEGPSWS